MIIPTREHLACKAHWKIEKFKGDFKSRDEATKAKAEPFETIELDDEADLLLNVGINAMWTYICSGGIAGWPIFSNGNAIIWVGDSAATAVATQTGILAVTNKASAGMATSYPTFGASQQVVFQASFASAVGNFAWNEICVGISAATGATNCLNRLVQAMGTKAAGTTWVATLTISLT